MDQSLIFMLAFLILIGGIAFALICFVNRKGSHRINVEQYRIKYLEIENSLKREDVSSYSMSVLNADKLLHQAMRDLGISGVTMGDRLKAAANRFSDLNKLWSAHKLRNNIAHEVGFKLTYDDARYAVASFKRALKDLGAI